MGLLEEAGRHVAPLPLLPTLVYGALTLCEFGSDAQRQRWLPGVASGETILSAALQELGSEDPAQPRTVARSAGDHFVLEGEKICVPAARWASRILVPARSEDGQVGLFLLDPSAPGVLLEQTLSMNHERQFRMTLEGARVPSDELLGSLGRGCEITAWLVARARVALCALQVGVSESALRQTAEYTSTRKQFAPIHRFLLNKWWSDELYDWLVVKPFQLISVFHCGF